MLPKRQTSGAVVCFSCQNLVSANSETCPHCGQGNPSLWGYARSIRRLGADFGFLQIVTWGCIGLYLAALLIDLQGITSMGLLRLLSPSAFSLWILGATGSIPLFEDGRWWTVLSAGWLHGGLLHIAFNLIWIRYLMPAVAQAYGAGRLVSLYVLSAVTGALFTSMAAEFLPFLPPILQGAGLSIGASGAVFGLLGALVSYGQWSGRQWVLNQALGYAAITFVLGFMMSNVDNWGHLGGFLGGYGLTQLPWFNPTRPQRLVDLGIAIVALLLTVGSIVASVVTVVFGLSLG